MNAVTSISKIFNVIAIVVLLFIEFSSVNAKGKPINIEAQVCTSTSKGMQCTAP